MPPSSSQLADQLAAERTAFLTSDPARDLGTPCMHRHADLVDGALRRIYALALQQTHESHGAHFEQGVTEIALVATGGYGRRELAPFSDIDIAFVPSHEENPFVDAWISNVFRLLVTTFLDATDYDVGYAYRPLSDVPTLDHETKTSLLDARLVVGSRKLLERLRVDLRKHIDVVSYLQHKAEERLWQTDRPPTSVYSVAPDLKNGAGGLRDIHSAVWMAQVRYGTHSRAEALEGLVRDRLVAANECQAVRDGEEYLRRVRTYLHLHAGRRQDVLLPEVQGGLGRVFGYESGPLTAGQQFMADHYRRTAQIHRFSVKVAKKLLWAKLPLSPDYLVLDGRLHSASPPRLRERPESAVEAFRLAQRYRLDFDPELYGTIETVVSLLPAGAPLPEDTVRSLLDFLAGSLQDTELLREMRDLGLLRRLLPELGAMMNFVPPDPAHEVTVGEHALRVVDQLARVAATPQETPSLPAEVLAEIEDRALLVLAALLHDVGKVRGEGDHSLIGAEMAAEAAQRLSLEEARARALVTLVREHLTLARTSRLLDLADPATLREAARAVGNRETLKLLYLLSYADTRAVGAGSYTLADLDMLGELYLRVTRSLSEGDEAPDLHSRAERKREEVSRELAASSISSEAVARLCESLPPGYLLNTPLNALATHAAFLDQLEREGPVIDFYNAPEAGYTELTLCVHDSPEPGLLSRVAGAVYAHELDIHSAQVFTLQGDRNVVLDTLWVSDRGRQLTEAAQDRLAGALRSLVEPEETSTGDAPGEGQPDEGRLTVHHLSLSNDLSDVHTVVRVTAEDVPGLLYFLTRTISQLGLDIHVAKITTWSGRAEDSFYVSDSRHRKLPDEELPDLTDRLQDLLRT